MSSNFDFREQLAEQAQSAFIVLSDQINNIFDLVQFYIDRFPMITPGDYITTRELNETVNYIGEIFPKLAAVLQNWKLGVVSLTDRYQVETELLNELWVNSQVLLNFLSGQEIDTSQFDQQKAISAFYTLVRCNRLLT